MESRLPFLECKPCTVSFSLMLTLGTGYRGGMVAPILGGLLLMIHRSVPVYTSVVVFVMAGICVLLLKENGATVGMERERITTH